MNYGQISIIPKRVVFEEIRKSPREYAKKCDRGYVSGRITNFKRLSECITSCVWSPCIFRNGYRSEKNFLSSDWAVLDIDDPGFSLEQAKNQFADSIHLIGTTKSHQKEKNGIVCDRFRLCLKFETTITDLATYRHNLSKIVNDLDADPKCIDGARLFWPCVTIESTYDDPEAFTVDVIAAPQFKRTDYREVNKLYKQNKQVPPWLNYALEHGCRDGQRNSTSFKVASCLANMGYSADAIFRRIMQSPIPIDTSEKVEREVYQTIKSAFRSNGRGAI